MARYTASVCRICRRENLKMYLKGDRCYTDKCAIERRPYPPGQHGQGRVTLFDHQGKVVDGAFRGIELSHSAVEASLTICNPAFVLGLGPGDFLIGLGQSHGVHHHGCRADAHPKGAAPDDGRHTHLLSGGQHKGAHFSARTDIEMPLREKLFNSSG